MAEKGRNVAGFALDKSAIYSYFFDEVLEGGRDYATAARFDASAQSFAQRALHAPYASGNTV